MVLQSRGTEVGRAKAKGKRTDTENLRPAPSSGSMDQQTWMLPTETPTLPARRPPLPPPQGTEKSLPKHADPTPIMKRKPGPPRGLRGNQSAGRMRAQACFYHSGQKHDPPSSHIQSRSWVQGKDYPPTLEALTVTGIRLVPVLQDGSVQLLPGTAHTLTLPKRATDALTKVSGPEELTLSW
jgi:hypothetical protein